MSEKNLTEADIPMILAGDEAVVARRYARALFEYAQEKGAIEVVEANLTALKEVIDSDPHYHAMAKHPRLSAKQLYGAISELVEAVQFHEVTASFLKLIARNHRLADLGVIIDAFKGMMAKMRGEYKAVVTAAEPLSDAQQERLATQLGAMIGGTVRLIVREDKGLIGGMVIKLDSTLIDASIKGKLTRLERQLKSQQEAA